MARGPRCAIVAVAALFATFAGPARADMTKDQCIDANARGQDLRHEGKLAEARAQLSACADPSCPALVRSDCNKRLDDLESAQPTIVFDLRDASGADVFDVGVRVDGVRLAAHLDGTALRVDPGVHVFVFEINGAPEVTQKILVKEGEVGRHQRVVLPAPPGSTPPAPVASLAPAPAPSPPAAPSSALPASTPGAHASSGLGAARLVGLVLGGAGVAALALGTGFGVAASAAWSHAKSACGGDTSLCVDVERARQYRSTTETEGAVSTVSFVAGGALLAAGAALLFFGHHGAEGSARLVPVVGPGQVGVVGRGEF